MSKVKECPARGCDTWIINELVCCSDHWREIPEALRRSITFSENRNKARYKYAVEQARAFFAGEEYVVPPIPIKPPRLPLVPDPLGEGAGGV